MLQHLCDKDVFPDKNDQYWNLLEVNSKRFLEEATLQDYVNSRLRNIENYVLIAIWVWLGFQLPSKISNLRQMLIDHITSTLSCSQCKTIVLISEFVYGRSPEAIERVAKFLLTEDQFTNVNNAPINANSRRLCYALLIYLHKPSQLQLLALFASAERSGYTRYNLIVNTTGKNTNESTAELNQKIEQGYDLSSIDTALIRNIMSNLDGASSQRRSLCSDVFYESQNNSCLIFIWRYLREAHIREVDGVIFANEAELVILRLSNNLRSIEVNKEHGSGVRIAQAIASKVYSSDNLKYVLDAHFTPKSDIENLLQNSNNSDRFYLRELQLKSSSIENTPELMIRGQHNLSITESLEFLKKKGVDLLKDLADVKHFKLCFTIYTPNMGPKAYIFKIALTKSKADKDRYLLTYPGANIPMYVCTEFENYIKNEYKIHVIPRINSTTS